MRDYYSSKRRTHIYILPGSGYIPDIDLVSNLHIQPIFLYPTERDGDEMMSHRVRKADFNEIF